MDKGKKRQQEWQSKFDAYKKAFPKEAAELEQSISGKLAEDFAADLPKWKPADKPIATRVAGGEAMNALAKHIPNIDWRIGRPESFHEHRAERPGRFPAAGVCRSGHAGRGGRQLELCRP